MGKIVVGPGDVIFVPPTTGDEAGQLVALKTHGPFCHVQIAYTQNFVLEALTHSGVTLNARVPLPSERVAAVGATLDTARLTHALRWGYGLVGHTGYSWYDIAVDILNIALPRGVGSRTPFLIAPSQYDCSDFVTRMLALAGYMWLPDELFMNPSRVSPNDLARALGVLT